jgi:hypothetical protein
MNRATFLKKSNSFSVAPVCYDLLKTHVSVYKVTDFIVLNS